MIIVPAVVTLVPRYSVELIAERNTHKYKVTVPVTDFQPIFPGVTGVLGVIAKPALIQWAKKESLNVVARGLRAMLKGARSQRVTIGDDFITRLIQLAGSEPDKLKDEAAALGTEAHALIDIIVKGGSPKVIPDGILEPIAAFAAWWKASGLTFLLGDTKVASLVHRFGGSLDALAFRRVGERIVLVLLDWKTSKGLYDEYALQVAAYVKAFEEMYGVKIDEAWCVRFQKPGVPGVQFEALRVADIDKSFAAFLDAKRLQENLKEPHFVRVVAH